MHRAPARLVTVLCALGAALALTPAFARPWRVQQIPNGNVNGCYTCHLSNGYWNAFGLDLKNNYGIDNAGAPAVPWPKVYDTDSDGDGQTNGQELGDPCGVWTAGCAPQFTTGVSNPGDPTSTTSTIPTCTSAGTPPACQSGGSGGSGGSSGSGGGGTPGTAPPSGCTAASGPASFGAFLLIALAGLLARRRRVPAGR